MRGQTNFVRKLWKFDKVYDPKLQLADHKMPVKYEMKPPVRDTQFASVKALSKSLYVHEPLGLAGRQLDEETEKFVDASRSVSTLSNVRLILIQFLSLCHLSPNRVLSDTAVHHGASLPPVSQLDKPPQPPEVKSR